MPAKRTGNRCDPDWPKREGVQSDASILAELDKLYTAVKERKGKLDIVLANAGVVRLFAS
jgi:NAD(P)-dependent dehydrogenase (short-subunit alcohol dehydrogenase family)